MTSFISLKGKILFQIQFPHESGHGIIKSHESLNNLDDYTVTVLIIKMFLFMFYLYYTKVPIRGRICKSLLKTDVQEILFEGCIPNGTCKNL